MDQHICKISIEACSRCDLRRKDLVDSLNLAEMVASADAAERGIKGGIAKVCTGKGVCHVALPRLVERVHAIDQMIEPQLARCDIQLEQSHATANVGADHRWENLISQNGAANRPIFARMQIGHGGDRPDSREPSDMFQLQRYVALDPRFGRGEDVDRRAAVHVGRNAH